MYLSGFDDHDLDTGVQGRTENAVNLNGIPNLSQIYLGKVCSAVVRNYHSCGFAIFCFWTTVAANNKLTAFRTSTDNDILSTSHRTPSQTKLLAILKVTIADLNTISA
ncbi:unnamed protein product [Calicophoron daubneyi]|uniref:Uncharacterized protein n=1 Tax=Calicophoron daubneyi TaxID=300641 RepID=A0AAV2T5V6_CALDB